MKKYLTVDNVLIVSVVVLALICIILMAAPAINIEFAKTTYSGAQITFGYSEKRSFGTVDLFGFSFGYFITYIFVIAGIVCAVISFAEREFLIWCDDNVELICGAVSVGCFLLAGIFFFQAVSYCNIPGGNSSAVETIRATYTLGGGAITSGIFSLICSGLMAIFTVKELVDN